MSRSVTAGRVSSDAPSRFACWNGPSEKSLSFSFTTYVLTWRASF